MSAKRMWLRLAGLCLAVVLGAATTAAAQQCESGGPTGAALAGSSGVGGNLFSGGGACLTGGPVLGNLFGGATPTSGCATCNRFLCPPIYFHCQEGPPCIKIQCGCPRPVSCPCDQPGWGYYQTTWRQWPGGGPNCSPGPVLGPQAALPYASLGSPPSPPAPEGPAPRKINQPAP